jgi:hypothetical protein
LFGQRKLREAKVYLAVRSIIKQRICLRLHQEKIYKRLA